MSCKLSSFPDFQNASGSSGHQEGHKALLPTPRDELISTMECAQKLCIVEDQSSWSILRMSVEGQTVHRYGPGPLHRSEFLLTSLLESSLTKSRRERESDSSTRDASLQSARVQYPTNPAYLTQGDPPWAHYPQSTRSLDRQGESSQPRATPHKAVPLPHSADARRG